MADHKRSLSASTWSDLPSEIVSNIEKRLDSAVDVSQLHSVCKNWRSCRNPNNSSILSPFLPRIIPNLSLPFTDDRPDAHVTLVAHAVFLVKPLQSSSSSCGWLLTVEEPVPGKLRILYPLSKDHVKHLPSNIPKYIDLSKFKVSQVAKSYGFKYSSDGENVPNVRRIVLCSETTIVVLYGEGTILRLRLKSGNWGYLRHSVISSFLDVICYGENHVQAIDHIGNVHIIDHRMMKVVKTILSKPVFDHLDKMSLIRSNEDLFAVAYFQGNSSTETKFVIYRLDEVQCKWINVGNTNFCWKVLFISSDWSFFVYYHELNLRHYSPKPKRIKDEDYLSAQEMMRGDYVIFSENSFGCSNYNIKRLHEGASLDLRISVFFCNNDDLSFWKEPHCSRTTNDVLWPPPMWFLPQTSASIREDKDLNIDSHNASSCIIKEASPPYMVYTSAKTVAANKQAVGNSNTPTVQPLAKEEESRSSFRGIEVQSDHLAILQDVWKKHGDVFEGSALRSYEAKAMALACLAKILIILQTPGEGHFTNDQVAYLESALADLQFMRLKLDWLIPSVEPLLVMHKQLEADFVALEEAKAKVEKTGKRILVLKAEVKQGLDIDLRVGERH